MIPMQSRDSNGVDAGLNKQRPDDKQPSLMKEEESMWEESLELDGDDDDNDDGGFMYDGARTNTTWKPHQGWWHGLHTQWTASEWLRSRRCSAMLCLATLLVLLLLLLLLLLIFAVTVGRAASKSAGNVTSQAQNLSRRSVILMISDGYGPSSVTLTRSLHRLTRNVSVAKAWLPLDRMLAGQCQTASASSDVTDSAAAATAFACAMKTDNGAIGGRETGSDFAPCGTVLEAAKQLNFVTGLVATSRITHATPAGFSAHVPGRSDEETIALQQLRGASSALGGRPVVDVLMGGGVALFSARSDGLDLVREAAESGWTVARNRSAFDALLLQGRGAVLPVLSLLTDQHMSYEMDRDPAVEPSLSEMAYTSLRLLDRAMAANDSVPGFFLMIEGSRIDMAAHVNDPIGHLYDALAYQEAVQVAQQYVDSHPGTLLISVSDHETGGASLGTYQYAWSPERLLGANITTELGLIQLMHDIATFPNDVDWLQATSPQRIHLEQFLNQSLGLATEGQPLGYSNQDVLDVLSMIKELIVPLTGSPTLASKRGFNPSNFQGSWGPVQHKFASMVSDYAQVGWTTTGHTGTDINFYLYTGPPSNSDQSAIRSLGRKRKRFVPFLNQPTVPYQAPILTKSFTTGTYGPLFLSEESWPDANQTQGQRPSIMMPEALASNLIDNTDIAKIISNYLGVDLASVTTKLRSSPLPLN